MRRRAVELAQQAIDLVGDGDPLRAALLHEASAATCTTWPWRRRPGGGGARSSCAGAATSPSAPRYSRLGNLLMVAWRYDESVAARAGLALARAVGAHQAEVLALRALGAGLAYLGRGNEGLAQLWLALRLAEERSDPVMAHHAYVTLTDVLTMLGRPRESARLAATALEALHRYGLDQTTLVANQVEALVAIGKWTRPTASARSRSAP